MTGRQAATTFVLALAGIAPLPGGAPFGHDGTGVPANVAAGLPRPEPSRRQTRRQQQPQVTFTRDVAPILFTACVSCHRPEGIAPFSLLTYDDARSHAAVI